MNSNHHNSWNSLFDEYANQINLNSLYVTEVYPPRDQIYRAFEMSVNEIRVVLLGQDPYHGPGQAHGLSFSVPDDIVTPPSLRNIYKEILHEFPDREYKFQGGNLERWHSHEKIFLLNSSLTVVKGKPGTHIDEWKQFTDNVIQFIAKHNEKCVFLLLGDHAKSKAKLIPQKSKIVIGVHPSPMTKGFLGSGVFAKVESALGKPIHWSNKTM